MNVALITVGDELLAGDTENTNATWLARELTDRGVAVRRVLVLPDDRAAIADAVDRYREAFDAVILTGGLGGTHDDVTMAAVADALDRPLAVDEAARADVAETVAAFRESNPELFDRYPEMGLDFDAQASIPEGARPLLNPVGLAPGCVADGVYVLPGIPEEMKATFETVADEFAGAGRSVTLHTPVPEGALAEYLADARDRFDVAVGSYPSRGEEHNRVEVSGEDPEAIDRAVAWIRERIEIVADPETGDDQVTGDAEDSG
ncbi:competence/damage-inducible protein A [Halobacteriales archaeon QS_8_69_26]|nr:MAG: competence/damage-inducible protein A [Halobacteriales archaeon QS_8_69_26]